MPDGSLEAGMQLVYERKSCNITLHRDLSGPAQRAAPPSPTPPNPPPRLFGLPPLDSPLRFSSLSQLNGPVKGCDHGSQEISVSSSIWPHRHLSPFTYGNKANTQGKDALWPLSPAYSCAEALFKTPELHVYVSEHRSP